MSFADQENKENINFQKGVKHLCENGIKKVPKKYVIPVSERSQNLLIEGSKIIDLPIIDFSQLQGPNRHQVLESLSKACQDFGFFQLVNHGVTNECIVKMMDVNKRFFELPFEEREKYMSSDIYAPVRCGTSFNQNKDGVFCWRDFLKISCHPMQNFVSLWPSSPLHLRQAVGDYSRETRSLYKSVMKAIIESLGLNSTNDDEDSDDNNQIMMVNCYPPCPEPEVTMGLPAHSDYGLLTLLLQDEVEGLQIQHNQTWLSVKPIPNSFVVNIGDQFEIYSNGRYKSVVHRAVVNSMRSRISIASLHSLPVNMVIEPSLKLVTESNPKRYRDTKFADFLDYLSSSDFKCKSFIESRVLY